VNNPQPDKDIVDAANVIGKVVFTVPGMGKALSNLNEKIIFAMIFLGLLLLLSFTLQVFFGMKKQEQPKRDLSKA
ncbi:MAG: hypothetical protein LBB91_05550, partial [Clostridiales bacterium]|jgi:hypothetical protein|nr:hypothetical protein [Clostridiales bacterium]